MKYRKEDWRTTILSDEKKFNLHGSDAWEYSWHDMKTEERFFKASNIGRGFNGLGMLFLFWKERFNFFF